MWFKIAEFKSGTELPEWEEMESFTGMDNYRCVQVLRHNKNQGCFIEEEADDIESGWVKVGVVEPEHGNDFDMSKALAEEIGDEYRIVYSQRDDQCLIERYIDNE